MLTHRYNPTSVHPPLVNICFIVVSPMFLYLLCIPCAASAHDEDVEESLGQSRVVVVEACATVQVAEVKWLAAGHLATDSRTHLVHKVPDIDEDLNLHVSLAEEDTFPLPPGCNRSCPDSMSLA